jgi:nitrate/TMAO reductase-like tetraheme cytochrome c subunit
MMIPIIRLVRQRLQSFAGRAVAIFAVVPFAFGAASEPPPAVPVSSCLSCHTDLEKSAGTEGAAALWAKSVHKDSGIACDACHGGDPAQTDAMEAMSPERGFIGTPPPDQVHAFCGRCHITVAEHFMKSKHWTSEELVKPNCVTCHSAHEQKKVSVDLINETACAVCHTYERADQIKKALFVTDNRIAEISEHLTKLKYLGYDTRRLEETHFALRNLYHTLFHELQVPVVEQKALEIAHDLQNMETTLKGLDTEERNRRTFGYFLLGLFTLAAVATRQYRKSLRE